jgi:CysZ protein
MLTALALFAGLSTLGILLVLAHAHGVVAVLLAIPVVLVALLLAVALAQTLSGWALDGIVRAQRRELSLAPLPELSVGRAALSSLVASLAALAVGVPVLAILALIGLAVPPAAVVTVPLKIVVGALVLGWNLVDYPLALQGTTLGGRLRWAREHLAALLGFGLAATLLFAVPGLGLLVLPCGVAGATRLLGAGGEGAVRSAARAAE